MTYYIVGKKTKEGTLASDSSAGVLSEYFELGWEYVASHIYIKQLHADGGLSAEDVIVTLEDRMFLYQGFWKNVISNESFNCQKISSEDTVIDLCNIIENHREMFLPRLDANGRYVHWDKMKNIISNIKYKDIRHLNTKSAYCCLHIRYRGWAAHRNISADFWHNLIQEILKTGTTVYVFGKEATEFANSRNVIHVSLEEYASLLNNENCKFVVGGMSGGTLVAQTFAHIKCRQYVIISDEQTLREFNTNNQYSVFYHIPGMNFSEAPIHYVSLINNEMMTEYQLIQNIKQ